MVKLEGSYEFEAPQEVVWEAVQEPHVLSRVLPGCERLEQTAENEYEGEINIRVGPVQGTFQGSVKLSDVQPPTSYHLALEGQGRPGYVQGAGALRLESNGDASTTLHYTGEAQLSGRIASVGQRLIDSTARSLTRQGLESLDRIIQARMQPAPTEAEPAPAAPPPPAVTPPSTAEVGLNVAKDVAADVLRDLEEQPGVRRWLVIGAAVLIVLWMWRRLFGRD